MKKNNNKKDSFDIDNIVKYGVKPPNISDVQLEFIKSANEQFGVKVLSLEELGLMRLTPKNVEILNKNIQRENRIITGEYLKDKNTTYLNNYIDILDKAGVDHELLQRIREAMSKMGNKYMVATLLPPLKEFYITLKRGRDKKGRFISISDQVDTMEEQVRTALNDLESLGYV